MAEEAGFGMIWLETQRQVFSCCDQYNEYMFVFKTILFPFSAEKSKVDESTAQVWKLSAMDMVDDDIDLVDEYVLKSYCSFSAEKPKVDESTAQVWKLSELDMGDADINPLDEYVFKKPYCSFFQQRNRRWMNQQLRCGSCLRWIWVMLTLIM